MVDVARPTRRHLNADQKRALEAAVVCVFTQQYGRKAQRGVEPNDRRYSREMERKLKQLKPERLDLLMRDDED
ncbi:hypothetical protein [Bradyrhizobium stylosanthis]|uniref:hypothetical protein n=1 Tax=Bradyrhizobium stylosanthis TaxID=1803665 RepID=UPI000A9076D5|nr:hypothetical protein [Bradyrhizobium stylosanthis]